MSHRGGYTPSKAKRKDPNWHSPNDRPKKKPKTSAQKKKGKKK